jgi:hypothetical protein
MREKQTFPVSDRRKWGEGEKRKRGVEEEGSVL